MAIYAEILDNKVHTISEIDDNAIIPSDTDILFVDITNEDPMPEQGDSYIDGIFYSSDDDRLSEKYELVQFRLPNSIISSMTDAEIDSAIDSFYYGHVDVDAWKLENYSFLREIFYPDAMEKADAEVKINSGIESFASEGELQLSKYIEDCINVKIRFPKE